MIRELVADGDAAWKARLMLCGAGSTRCALGGRPPACSTESMSTTTGPRPRSNSWPILPLPDPRTISTVYDKGAVNSVVRAIQESDWPLRPTWTAMSRLNIPTLTAERRKDLVKLVRSMAEDGRVAVRNVRRDVIQDLKDLKKEGEISEDDERRAEEEVRKLTDRFIEKINEVLRHKRKRYSRSGVGLLDWLSGLRGRGGRKSARRGLKIGRAACSFM